MSGDGDLYDEIVRAQGWNDETMRLLAERFIEQFGRREEYLDYLRVQAEEENAEFIGSGYEDEEG